VRLLLAATPLSLASGVVLFGLVTIAVGIDHVHPYLILLFVFGWIQHLAASIYVGMSSLHVHLKLTVFRIAVFVYAAIFGVDILGIYLHSDYSQRIFLLLAMMGLTAGGVLSFSADKRVSIPFYIATIFPVVAAMFLDFDTFNIYAAGGFFYLLFMLSVLVRLNASVVKSLESEYISSESIKKLERVRTRLETSETRYRSLVVASRDGIVVLLESVVVFSNPSFKALVGANIDDKCFIDYISETDRHAAAQNEKSVLAGFNPGNQDLRLMCGDGNIRWIELNSVLMSWAGHPAVMSFVRDITNTMVMQSKLNTVAAYKDEMERMLVSVAEEKQRSIGRELHDNLGQELTGLWLQTQSLSNKLARANSSSDFIKSANFISERTNVAMTLCRDLAHGLSPFSLDSDGLPLSLGDLATSVSYSTDIDCKFVCKYSSLRIRPDVSTHLYRITQEAVSNSVRHGKCSKILISLHLANGMISLSIKDDGVGIVSDIMAHSDRRSGIGMQLMLYRTAQIEAELKLQRPDDGGIEVIVNMEYWDERRKSKEATVN